MARKAYAAQLVDLHGLDVAVALVPLHTEARAASAPLVVASRPAPAGLTGWDLLGADPEVDLEHVGRKVPHVSRVYVTGSGSLPLTAPVRVDVETPRSPTKRTDSARAGMVPTKRLPLAALSHGGEKVYDVVWAGDRKPGADGKLPPVGNTVDVANATWTNTIGAPELITVWKDPDFDPKLRAFYYARVIEIPTPRWTAYEAARYGIRMPPEVPMTTQERAYTSPIWYTP